MKTAGSLNAAIQSTGRRLVAAVSRYRYLGEQLIIAVVSHGRIQLTLNITLRLRDNAAAAADVADKDEDEAEVDAN